MEKTKKKNIIMYSLVIILITILGIKDSKAQTTCGRFDTTQEGSGGSCTYGDREPNTITIDSYWADSASALAAAQAELTYLQATIPAGQAASGPYGPTATDNFTGGDGDVWQRYTVIVSACSETQQVWYGISFLFEREDWVDENEDCVADDDQDCSQQCYAIWKGYKNNSGEWLYVKVVTTGGDVLSFGDPQEAVDCMTGATVGCTLVENDLVEYDLQNSNPETCDNACGIAEDLDLATSTSGDFQETEFQEPEKGTEGQESDQYDTDSETYDKIANNTSEIANNTDGLEDGLTDITNQLIEANKTLDEIANKPIASLDIGKLTAEEQANIDSVGEMSEDIDPEDYEYTEGSEGDIEEETSIGDFLDTVLNDNPLGDWLDNISITSSNPACSIEDSYEVYGTTIDVDISLCEWETQLELMGNILYALAVLVFIMIIFL
jgi:archaellum component FlaC